MRLEIADLEVAELLRLRKENVELRTELSAAHLQLDAIGQVLSDDPGQTIPPLAIPTQIRLLHKREHDLEHEVDRLEQMIDDAVYAFDGGQHDGETLGDRLVVMVETAKGGKLLVDQAANMNVSPLEAAKFFHTLTEKLS